MNKPQPVTTYGLQYGPAEFAVKLFKAESIISRSLFGCIDVAPAAPNKHDPQWPTSDALDAMADAAERLTDRQSGFVAKVARLYAAELRGRTSPNDPCWQQDCPVCEGVGYPCKRCNGSGTISRVAPVEPEREGHAHEGLTPEEWNVCAMAVDEYGVSNTDLANKLRRIAAGRMP